MNALSVLSRAAQDAGVPPRYRYFFGASGERRLFTASDRAALADFTEGVVIAVRGECVVWVGDLAEMGRMPSTPWVQGSAFYVHLLAASDVGRRAVVNDMRPVERGGFRLAA